MVHINYLRSYYQNYNQNIETKVLKDNTFIDNKLYYYLKPADLPVPRFYGQPKIHNPGVPMDPVVSYSGSPLYKVYIL